MKAVVSLILLCTCFAADADNNGPSNYLTEKWRVGYSIMNQNMTARCFRTCSSNEDDVYWNDMLGKAAHTMAEDKFIEFITNVYTRDILLFTESIRNDTEKGMRYIDADGNNFISAEEYYTEHLCIGFKLKTVKAIFDAMEPAANGILISDIIEYYLELFTLDNAPGAILEAMNFTNFD